MSSIISFRCEDCSIILADSLSTVYGIQVRGEKVRFFKDGVVGCVGAEASLHSFLTGARRDFDPNTTLVVADRDGLSFVSNRSEWERQQSFSAFGWYADAFIVAYYREGIKKAISLFADVVHGQPFFYVAPPLIVGVCSSVGSVIGELSPGRVLDFVNCFEPGDYFAPVGFSGKGNVIGHDRFLGVRRGQFISCVDEDSSESDCDARDTQKARHLLRIASELDAYSYRFFPSPTADGRQVRFCETRDSFAFIHKGVTDECID